MIIDEEKYTWKTGMIAGLEEIQKMFSEQKYVSKDVEDWLKRQIFITRNLDYWVKILNNTPSQEYARGFEEAWKKTSYLFPTDSSLIMNEIEKKIYKMHLELEKE